MSEQLCNLKGSIAMDVESLNGGMYDQASSRRAALAERRLYTQTG